MSTNSIKSDALEPTRAEMKHLSAGEKLGRLIPVFGLPILTVALIVLFSLLLPDTFDEKWSTLAVAAERHDLARLDRLHAGNAAHILSQLLVEADRLRFVVLLFGQRDTRH